MNWARTKHVCPLHSAENNLLQVLLSKFSLFRQHDRVFLELAFDRDSPAIRRREAKGVLKESMPNFFTKSVAYQEVLNSVLLDNRLEVFNHDDSDFVFRYANGGTLPILNLDGTEYYCLFFRCVDPIGWNIANGASDSLEELFDPLKVIDRELREELIILDLEHRKDYVLQTGNNRLILGTEFRVPRELWLQRIPTLTFSRFRPAKAAMRPVEGPDSLKIQFGLNNPKTFDNFFLNITAKDFGIEIDKIASITCSRDVLVLDGEVHDHKLLNRPIGLFNVARIEKEIENKGETAEYFPDLLYYSGQPWPPSDLGRLVDEDSIPRLLRENLLKPDKAQEFRAEQNKYKLCPVTRQIIKRKIGRGRKADRRPPMSPLMIFVSYADKDFSFAEQLCRDLRKNGFGCWFAPDSLPIGDKIRERIDEKIRTRDKFLVVLSASSIGSVWVEAEVEAAFDVERRRGVTMLYPVQIDDSIMEAKTAWAAHIRRTRNIGDFRQWKDPSKYEEALKRLVEALRRGAG